MGVNQTSLDSMLLTASSFHLAAFKVQSCTGLDFKMGGCMFQYPTRLCYVVEQIFTILTILMNGLNFCYFVRFYIRAQVQQPYCLQSRPQKRHGTKLDQTKDTELRTNPVSVARAALAHSAGARLALDPGVRARHRTGSPGTGPRLLLHLQ